MQASSGLLGVASLALGWEQLTATTLRQGRRIKAATSGQPTCATASRRVLELFARLPEVLLGLRADGCAATRTLIRQRLRIVLEQEWEAMECCIRVSPDFREQGDQIHWVYDKAPRRELLDCNPNCPRPKVLAPCLAEVAEEWLRTHCRTFPDRRSLAVALRSACSELEVPPERQIPQALTHSRATRLENSRSFCNRSSNSQACVFVGRPFCMTKSGAVALRES